MRYKALSSVLFFLVIALAVTAQNPQLVLTQFSTGYSSPTDIANCGDSRLFIVERKGKIYIADSNGVKQPVPFLDISDRVNQGGSERGLLGLAFDPDYKHNRYFYVNYVSKSPGNGYTRISRFRTDSLNSNLADAQSEEILLSIYQPYTNHKGGCLQFGPDGYLYDSQGDGGSGGDPENRAQQKDTLLGKMLRLDVDTVVGYKIPGDNPFVNGGGRPEIWAYGLRNPWRFSFDRLTGDLWIADVGQGDYEEINFQPAASQGGQNYGWKCYEGNHPYSAGNCNNSPAGITFPVFEYSHSLGCSVTGGFVYRGTLYNNMFGKYFFTDYCSGNIWALAQDGQGGFQSSLLGDFAKNTYSSFGEDRYGELYLAELSSGRIMKIKDTSVNKPVALILMADTLKKCQGEAVTIKAYEQTPLKYQWRLNGTEIPGATNAEYNAVEPGSYSVVVTNTDSSVSNAVTVIDYPETVIDFVLPVQGTQPGIFCSNSNQEFMLNATPAGGTFSGDGVYGDTLRPFLFLNDTSFITYSIADTNGCVYSKTNMAFVTVCTDAETNFFIENISVYPNPTTGRVRLDYFSLTEGNAEVTVNTLLGEAVLTVQKRVTPGLNNIVLDLGNRSAGIYFIQLKTQDKLETIKINLIR